MPASLMASGPGVGTNIGFVMIRTNTAAARYGHGLIMGANTTGPKQAQTGALPNLITGSTAPIDAIRLTVNAAAQLNGGMGYVFVR